MTRISRIRLAVAALLCVQLLTVQSGQAAEPSFDARDIVRHAGGVVEFRPPLGWHVWEAAKGREVELHIAPEKAAVAKQREFDGVTIVFHASRRISPPSQDQLASLQSERLQQLNADDSDSTSEMKQVAGHAAAHREYARGTRSGQHTMISTSWGLLEIRLEADSSTVHELVPHYAELLTSLNFNPPGEQETVQDTNVAEAAEILGSWKAYRARLTLVGDGRIVIRPDVTREKVDETYERNGFRTPKKIVGNYRAESDVLYVTWNDGSRLNLRWRLEGERLLLTDHNGLVTSLKPLLD